jgi:SAM-dependent methyltransferase
MYDSEASIANTDAPAQPSRQCPLCGWAGQEFSVAGRGQKQRYDARCPECGSFERHRLAFLVAEQCVALDFSKVVHAAPEISLEKWLRSKSEHYLSIDIDCHKAMAQMDLTELSLDQNTQSLFWASHVLEHIEDDRKAISEIHRVLIPGGKAFIQVPIWRANTFESSIAQTPKQRLESFYQEDHVRLYGWDIIDRFLDHGFKAELYRAQDFGPTVLLQHRISFASTDEVFVFTK